MTRDSDVNLKFVEVSKGCLIDSKENKNERCFDIVEVSHFDKR